MLIDGLQIANFTDKQSVYISAFFLVVLQLTQSIAAANKDIHDSCIRACFTNYKQRPQLVSILWRHGCLCTSSDLTQNISPNWFFLNERKIRIFMWYLPRNSTPSLQVCISLADLKRSHSRAEKWDWQRIIFPWNLLQLDQLTWLQNLTGSPQAQPLGKSQNKEQYSLHLCDRLASSSYRTVRAIRWPKRGGTRVFYMPTSTKGLR